MTTALLILLATVALIALVDYIPRFFNAAKPPVRIYKGKGRVPNYLIMPTVYGDISYLKNVDFLKKYASHVVICTSKYESEKFYKDLEAICEQNGLRFIAVDLPIVKDKPVKNAYTIYKGAFTDLEKLGVSSKTPCLLIDADTVTPSNVNDLIRTFSKGKFDIASLRCEVANVSNTLEILQDYEYRTAMDNRRMDPWLTSGACNMAQAGTFQHVFKQHSHFFAGGDIEIGKLAQTMGYKLRHINFSFYTEVPSTFREWFNQRIIWFAGGVRHHVVNISNFSWHHFFIFIYNSLIIYLLLPLRWFELIHFPLAFFLLILVSWLYIFIVNIGRGWRKEYFLLPAYAFIQSMIILPIAFVRYAKYALQQRSFGILHQDLSHLNWHLLFASRFLNITTAAIVLVLAVQFTYTRVEYWVEKDLQSLAVNK
ncbi:MAG TPA: glycosyltransferase family 2 protein [Candidatus Saccharimonadales bacterium]